MQNQGTLEDRYKITDYVKAAFFAYMHKNSVCPLTHEGLDFYFGKIYERVWDKAEGKTVAVLRDDLDFLVDEARAMKRRAVSLSWNRGIPHVSHFSE